MTMFNDRQHVHDEPAAGGVGAVDGGESTAQWQERYVVAELRRAALVGGIRDDESLRLFRACASAVVTDRTRNLQGLIKLRVREGGRPALVQHDAEDVWHDVVVEVVNRLEAQYRGKHGKKMVLQLDREKPFEALISGVLGRPERGGKLDELLKEREQRKHDVSLDADDAPEVPALYSYSPEDDEIEQRMQRLEAKLKSLGGEDDKGRDRRFAAHVVVVVKERGPDESSQVTWEQTDALVKEVWPGDARRLAAWRAMRSGDDIKPRIGDVEAMAGRLLDKDERTIRRWAKDALVQMKKDLTRE